MSRAGIRNLVVVLVALFLLVVLFFLLRPESPTPESSDGGQTQEDMIDLAIRGGNAMTPDQLSVNEGDHVMLNITSDEPLEFHLHGYDLATDLEAGEPAVFSFDATNTGRFEIENEQTQEELGELLVQPR